MQVLTQPVAAKPFHRRLQLRQRHLVAGLVTQSTLQRRVVGMIQPRAAWWRQRPGDDLRGILHRLRGDLLAQPLPQLPLGFGGRQKVSLRLQLPRRRQPGG